MTHLIGAVEDVYERVERLRIEDCFFRGGCRKRWQELEKTDVPDKRYCGDCKKHVHFLHSADELEKAKGEPICAAFLVSRTDA